MNVEMSNPDAVNANHGLNAAQLQLARFIESESLKKIKEILTRMGVAGITRNDTMQSMEPKMRRMKISVAHMSGAEDESQNGWWFRYRNINEVHLSEPHMDGSGRIHFTTRFMAPKR